MDTIDSVVVEDDGESKDCGQGDNNTGDDDTGDPEDNFFCTLAVTGTDPTFQAIFLCNECLLDPSMENGTMDATTLAASGIQQQLSPLCICQACAEICHDDGYHDVEYVGMGPSYCDCNRLGNCKLHQKSLREAERLGMIPRDCQQQKDKHESSSSLSSSTNFVREAFDIPILQQHVRPSTNTTLATLLVEQARELIRHSKETHWIDETIIRSNMEDVDNSSRPKKLCLLESLAWSIYRSHLERYKDMIAGDDDNDNDNDNDHDGVVKGGAEWWVQVKNLSNTIDDDNNCHADVDVDRTGDCADPPISSSSIDLHYDKDEALAESFGIGSFPVLSTVTYLTASSAAADPTVVFDHTYTQGEDEVMSSMFVSRPQIGKHICFDGRLLHGAPYHPSLLSPSSSPTISANEGNGSAIPESDVIAREESVTPIFRVTFLVNIWKDRRPASVNLLDDNIREHILQLPQLETILDENDALRFEKGNEVLMNPLDIPKVLFAEEAELPEGARDRIELPFVSNLNEEDEDEDDEDNNQKGDSTVVVTFPPPHTDDCVLVTFGPGLQAYIDYDYGSHVGEDGESYDAGQTNDETVSPTQTRQSDYV
eukprot:CAMPEP_0168226778 /NCGR_PEP_ID=MMETSP0140_2-20121125/13625_1 /TAXON_ID=44445 /ORGANISM="Pseudo-nitzschia australis, Strain 10249 10 AB" /LENGTH=596 /DNA_ID=CAMNT_0008157949 /DNA_START=30 /DNA_END=1820 /DNA_ORIENTATION=+